MEDVKKGDPRLQYNLGIQCMRSKKYEEAVKWFEKSANQNYAPSLFRLSRCYKYGMGVTKNIDMYVKLLKKSRKVKGKH